MGCHVNYNYLVISYQTKQISTYYFYKICKCMGSRLDYSNTSLKIKSKYFSFKNIRSLAVYLPSISSHIGGYVAHSLAIMTDAAHLLTDFGSILLSLFSLWISKKPASKSLTYGWHRSGWTDLSSLFYYCLQGY